MKKYARIPFCGFVSISLLLLAACQDTAAPPPTETPTGAATHTSTNTATQTDTPTIAFTPSETPTDAPTFTETPAYNIPGSYDIYKCVTFQPFISSRDDGADIILNFCVQTVKVNADLSMQFNVIWKYTYTATFKGTPLRGPGIIKTGFTNTVLIDNLKNEYKPVDAGGAAVHADLINSGSAIAGWYRFDPPKAGAVSFRLLDLDLRIAVENIVLLPDPNAPTPTPTPTADPNLTYNAPGTYYLYKCVYYPSPGNFGASKAKICLNTVVVNEAYEMKFVVTWTLYFDYATDIIKPSDANNHAIKVLDNLGNEYRHTQTGGCAAEDTRFWTWGEGQDDCGGWFLFPPPNEGATSFRFFDTENDISIENIVLVPKTG
jgi:hypothetical protein